MCVYMYVHTYTGTNIYASLFTHTHKYLFTKIIIYLNVYSMD